MRQRDIHFHISRLCKARCAVYNFSMVKKTTLNELGAMMEHVVKHMATKEDMRELKAELKGDIQRLDDRLAGVESKVAGIDRRLDAEAMRRDDEKIPARVAHLEKKVFGKVRA
jgi:predicted  nucleic acid-binding Zn-ribbon protein